jgi:transcriptional regulator with XRE-family HTH domain
MAERDSTARGRELGAELRRRRKAAGWQVGEVAHKAGWSLAKVSRLENGTRGQSEVDVAIYLTLLGVHREELNELLDLAREPDDGYQVRQHGERLPDELRTLVFHETNADSIHSYEPLIIPGLLQTERYARAAFRWAGLVPVDGIESRVRARMDRQGVLRRRDPPVVCFFIHENALRSSVGGPRVMNEQLLQLVFLTSLPHCLIRVVPADAGPQGGLGGQFRVMRYAAHGPVVYLENQTTSLFLEGHADVDTYRRILARLAEIALDEGQSREFLAHLANEQDRPEEGHDDRA